MDVAVLIEPTTTGFRASTGSPLDVSVEAPTEQDALSEVRARIVAKLSAGAKLVSVRVPDAKLLHEEVLTAARPQSAGGILANVPEHIWNDYLEGVAEARRLADADADAREQEHELVEAAANGHPRPTSAGVPTARP